MKKSTTKPRGATTYKETAFGIIPRSKLLKLELEGTKRGLEYLHDLIKENKNVKITPLLICKLHKISLKEAPFYFQVPELIFNLCNDLEERIKYLPRNNNEQFIIEVIKSIAWFQHGFVFIHPFQDYNGRTARMLTILILLKLNLPPIELKAEKGADKKRYLTAMQKADSSDYSMLETLLSNALSETLTLIQK